MAYYKFPLINLGYVDEHGNALDSINGRDNSVEPFRHLGYSYPYPGPYAYEEPGQYVVVESDTPIDGGVELVGWTPPIQRVR